MGLFAHNLFSCFLSLECKIVIVNLNLLVVEGSSGSSSSSSSETSSGSSSESESSVDEHEVVKSNPKDGTRKRQKRKDKSKNDIRLVSIEQCYCIHYSGYVFNLICTFPNGFVFVFVLRDIG